MTRIEELCAEVLALPAVHRAALDLAQAVKEQQAMKLQHRRLPQESDRWRHYKGNIATVFALAYLEATGACMVVYHMCGVMKVRPLDEWMGRVPGEQPQWRYQRESGGGDEQNR